MDAVQLENITHRYGKVLALDYLSLTVRQGEMFGFLGRNGAGKTTTLKLLMGLLRPHSGEIAVLGQPVKQMPATLKQPLVRFRPGMASNSAQYRTSRGVLSAAGKFTADVPDKIVTRGEVCFQPGLEYEGIVIYEPWVCLPESAASPG